MQAVVLDNPGPSEPPSVEELNLSDREHDAQQDYEDELTTRQLRIGMDVSHEEVEEQQPLDSDSMAPGNVQRITDKLWQERVQAVLPACDHTTVDEQYDNFTGQIAQISISHDGEYATAVCLAAQEPLEIDVGGEAAARDHL